MLLGAIYTAPIGSYSTRTWFPDDSYERNKQKGNDVWLVAADARGGGTRDESIRESAEEASSLQKKDTLLTILSKTLAIKYRIFRPLFWGFAMDRAMLRTKSILLAFKGKQGISWVSWQKEYIWLGFLMSPKWNRQWRKLWRKKSDSKPKCFGI